MTRVLLVGCPGAGRTTVGALVASRAGWPFLDDDVLLERTCGISPQELFRREGEQAVLAAQASTLNLLLAVPGPLVASVANGVLLQPSTLERLRSGGHVVWLRASPSTLARRLRGADDRPWLGGDPAATLVRYVEERSPLYAQVADQVIDVDVQPVGQVARTVLEGLPVGLRPPPD